MGTMAGSIAATGRARIRGIPSRSRSDGDTLGVVAATPCLSARGLTKSFGGRLVLDGLDLDVAGGDRIGVLGPNGGGKSTLLRILAGTEEADAGTVTRRRGLVWAHLPQVVEGDGRGALATLL